MKRLVVFCDGTWNRADKPAVTNVCKLRDAVDDAKDAPVPQIVKYEEGVGSLPWEKLRGGMFGVGLSRNVQRCYEFLVEHYEPGDQLFFFGFSRGAFTARSLAGLVRNSGILRREHGDKVKAAYKLYRSRKPDDAPGERDAKKFRDDHSHPDAEITFIGVWDTVGALGIPIDGFRPPFLSDRWTFHDTTLSSAVLNAYHAIAIDERRRPFEPTLWVKKKRKDGTIEEPPAKQKVEQVWFTGVHSDVGGGYPDPALSEIPLLWIADRAAACGLVLKPGHLVVTEGDIPSGMRRNGVQVGPDPHADPHDSLSFFYRRVLKPLDRELRTREGVPINSLLASTVGLRTAYDPPGLAQWQGGNCEVQRISAPPPPEAEA